MAKKSEAYKRWVRSRVAAIREHMLLHEWAVTLLWGEAEGPRCMASIDVDISYLRAAISTGELMETTWNEGNYDILVETITHEFSHILTEPLYMLAWENGSRAASTELERVREQQTQRIAQLILRGLPRKLFKKEL